MMQIGGYVMKRRSKGLVVALILLLTIPAVWATGTKEAAATESNVIKVFGNFRGEEAARFDEVVKIFNEKTGYNVVYEGSPEFETQILIQAEAGTPPDIAALPQPGLMKNFAEKGYLKPLAQSVLDGINSNYAPVWRELGSYDGTTYGVFHRVSAKSYVWYPKKAFEAKGYKVPTTWDELKALEQQIIADGGTPWSIGFEAGNATGWVGTDWIEDLMLRTAGPEVYDKWVNHEIPFDDPAVQKAFSYFGEIIQDPKEVYGGATNILTTSYGDAIKPLFENPPAAYLHRQANFITTFMPEDIQANLADEVGVFALPAIDEQWGVPMLGAGDQYVAFSDKPGVMEFLQFLTTWESCVPLAKAGGALFPHLDQNLADYGNPIEQQMAKMLMEAKVFRFDGSDLMPAEVGAGSFWTGMVDYVSGRDVKTVLSTIEQSWPQ